MKKLALFFDGTWNEPGDNTNVWRLKVMVASQDAEGVPQHTYYDTGVGTKWIERVRGGVAGAGLSRNVREAYQWLIEHYDDGDEVYLFGFSRGAYTARSVGGLIVKCGLLRPGAPLTTQQVYERYQARSEAIWELERTQRTGLRELTPEERRLLVHSRRIGIKMIGAWDTVGALGIPWTQAPLIGRARFYFHNTNLSILYEHAFQALAVDEHRAPYRAALWTQFTPKGEKPKRLPPKEKVEQRWFVGAHCNVGGGYADDDLAQIPLAWLQQKAIACGLAFRNSIQLRGDEYLCDGRDSYAEFLKGGWRALTLGRRYYRTIGADVRSVRGGTSVPVNEVIDASVFRRYQSVKQYRPKNIEEWAVRKGVKLHGVVGDHEAAFSTRERAGTGDAAETPA